MTVSLFGALGTDLGFGVCICLVSNILIVIALRWAEPCIS
jgi:hypothetical protein